MRPIKGETKRNNCEAAKRQAIGLPAVDLRLNWMRGDRVCLWTRL